MTIEGGVTIPVNHTGPVNVNSLGKSLMYTNQGTGGV